MKRISLITCLALLLLSSVDVLCQGTIHAKTDSGKDVILSPDGTWKYAPVVAPVVTVESSSPTATRKLFKPASGAFGIRYDANKWVQRQQTDDEGRIVFKLKRGDAYAMVIIEELTIPTSSLKKIALQNAMQVASDAHITFEETRVVSGKEVLCLRLQGTLDEIPFEYYSYYYGGKQGTIQLITYTGQSLVQKYEDDMKEFLNGLEIY